MVPENASSAPPITLTTPVQSVPPITHPGSASPDDSSEIVPSPVPAISNVDEGLTSIAPATPVQSAPSPDDVAMLDNDDTMADDFDDDHPPDEYGIERYIAAAATIGVHLQSSKASLLSTTGDPSHDFLLDHTKFMEEIDCPFNYDASEVQSWISTAFTKQRSSAVACSP